MTEGKGGVAGEKSTNQAMDTHFVGLKKESKTNRNRVGLGEVTRREGKEKGGGQHNTHCSSLILHFFFFFSSFFFCLVLHLSLAFFPLSFLGCLILHVITKIYTSLSSPLPPYPLKI